MRYKLINFINIIIFFYIKEDDGIICIKNLLLKNIEYAALEIEDSLYYYLKKQ